MASVNLTGTLTNPEGEPDEGAIVKFTLLTTTGTTVSSSKSQLEVPQDGLYDIDIVYGNLRVDYINEDGTTRFVAIVTVNGDTVATSLPELLNAAVPPTDAQLLEFQGILADAVTAQVAAEAAETGAVAAEATLLAEKLTTVQLIALSNSFAVGSVIDTLGYTSNGDGGGARWVKSGISGSTPSQSPAQKGGAVLSDGSGDVWALVVGGYTKAESLGLIGDGATDDLAVCNACLASGITEFPAKIIALSAELVIPEGSGIIGFNCFWKRRTTYNYTAGINTVFKYIGASGSNTTVIRASKHAVGTAGYDLTDVILKDFHVDAQGLADFALYMYRVGNQGNVGNITCEKAVIANHCHIGSYAAEFGVFGSYEAVGEGCSIGVDLFGIGTVESTNFEYKATFLTANNGTGNTYVKGSATDLENSGGTFNVGRGSVVYIRSESNFGRACILSQRNLSGGTSGPTDFVLSYVEANGDGPFLISRPDTDGIRIIDGFMHPGNGGSLLPQDITIQSQNNAGTPNPNDGPVLTSEWPVIQRMSGDLSGVGFAINSNTTKYTVRDCARNITFPASLPAFDDWVPTENQVGASCYFTAASPIVVFNVDNGVMQRLGVGNYRINFTRDFEVAGQHSPVVSILLSAALDTKVRLTSIGNGSVDFTTYNAAGSPADTGDRIGFTMSGRLEY